MAEHTEEFSPNAEPRSIIDKIEEKIQQHDSSSSSDSDDDKSEPSSSSAKTTIRRLFWREKPVHQVLGGGKPADIFLWRNKKISAGVFSVSTVIWILFELLEYQLLTVVSYGLISTLAILFLWSKAVMLINKFPPIIPELSIPEDLALNVTFSLRYQINKSFAVLRDIVSGRDLKKFLLVIFGLWVLSTIGSSCSFLTLLYIAFVLLHTVPAVYEKYEEKVDLYWEKAMEELDKHYTVIHASILTKIPKTAQLWAALACF